MITFSAFGILQLKQPKHSCSFPSLSLRKLTVTLSVGATWGTFHPLDQTGPAEISKRKNYEVIFLLSKPFIGKFRKFRDENDGNGFSGKKES